MATYTFTTPTYQVPNLVAGRFYKVRVRARNQQVDGSGNPVWGPQTAFSPDTLYTGASLVGMPIVGGRLYVSTDTVLANQKLSGIGFTPTSPGSGITHLWGCLIDGTGTPIKWAETEDDPSPLTAGVERILDFPEPGSLYPLYKSEPVYRGFVCTAATMPTFATDQAGATGGTANSGLTTRGSLPMGTAIGAITTASPVLGGRIIYAP